MIDLLFLTVYKKQWIKNCTKYYKTKEYHIFIKDNKIYYLETKDNLLLKKRYKNV